MKVSSASAQSFVKTMSERADQFFDRFVGTEFSIAAQPGPDRFYITGSFHANRWDIVLRPPTFAPVSVMGGWSYDNPSLLTFSGYTKPGTTVMENASTRDMFEFVDLIVKKLPSPIREMEEKEVALLKKKNSLAMRQLAA